MVVDDSNVNGFRFVKDITNIEIPTLLDMSPFVINARYTNNHFKLLSVGCHIGRMNGGHYYSVLRDQTMEENGEPNVWRVADDESSVSIKEEGDRDRDRFRQHLKHAYMLVYSKV